MRERSLRSKPTRRMRRPSLQCANKRSKRVSPLSLLFATSNASQTAKRTDDRLDFFFANAGITGTNFHMGTTEPDDFMDVFRVNTLSCFLAVKHASEAMKVARPGAKKEGEGGSIVLTASVAGMRSGAGPIDYSFVSLSLCLLPDTCRLNVIGFTNSASKAACVPH